MKVKNLLQILGFTVYYNHETGYLFAITWIDRECFGVRYHEDQNTIKCFASDGHKEKEISFENCLMRTVGVKQ